MGLCNSKPNVLAGAEAYKTTQYEAEGDQIRHFKSGHHGDDLPLDGDASSLKARAASFASSMSEGGGIAAHVVGTAIGAVIRDASTRKPGDARGHKNSKRSKQEPQQLGPYQQPRRDTLPGAPSPRASDVGGSTPTAGPSAEVPRNRLCPSSMNGAPISGPLPVITNPPRPSPHVTPPPGADPSRPSTPSDRGTAKKRTTVTFQEPSPPHRRVGRNKSRLNLAGGKSDGDEDTPDRPDPLPSHRSQPNPGPVLPPVSPEVPAAKGGRSEPGLWVLRRTGNVRTKYSITEKLGSGQFGSVCIATDRTNGTRWACKSVSKRRVRGMHDFSMADVLREVEVLYTVGGHPGVVSLREVYEDDDDLHLVMELCQGGDWFERLINFGRYTEAEAAATIRAILEALSYCHSLGVMHRDIKPENIMFVDRSETSPVKLTDFGLAALFQEGGDPLTEVLGSAYYVAPEVLRENYGKEADIWSTGVVLFIALGGYAPFDGANEREVFTKILYEPLHFKDSSWSHISQDAKHVISRMLTKDPKKRASIKELLAHPWLATCAGTLTPSTLVSPAASLSMPKAAGQALAAAVQGAPVSVDLSFTRRLPRGSVAKAVATAVKQGKVVKAVPDAVVARLQQFSAMNAFKRQARRVLAAYLPEEEMIGLMSVFKAMDKDGDGLLTMRELQSALADRGISISDANAKLMILRTDLDGDGAVDYSEFLAATLHLARLERDERLYKAFRHFDKNGTGFITRHDLEAALQHLPRVNVDKILAEVDVDGDGQLNYEEFCDMLRNDTEPCMSIFAENPRECATWGAWGEATESGRLVLAMPPDSLAPSRATSRNVSRNVSLATSRQVSSNERTSHVSIRRSLGGNMLSSSRNARQGLQAQLSHGNTRNSSSRFGSMRYAALMATNASDGSGRSSGRLNSGEFNPHSPTEEGGRSGQSFAQVVAGHGSTSQGAGVHNNRLELLEAVTEADSQSLAPSSQLLDEAGPGSVPVGVEPAPRSATTGGYLESGASPFSAQSDVKATPKPAPPIAWAAEGEEHARNVHAPAAHKTVDALLPRNSNAASASAGSTILGVQPAGGAGTELWGQAKQLGRTNSQGNTAPAAAPAPAARTGLPPKPTPAKP